MSASVPFEGFGTVAGARAVSGAIDSGPARAAGLDGPGTTVDEAGGSPPAAAT